MKSETGPSDTKKLRSHSTNLRAIGFCGADDSVNPKMLGLICNSYPFVEFGVLFRPGKEGLPRYASKQWVQELASVAKSSAGKMRLAAHLCGSRVNEVLDGDDAFVSSLEQLGFNRVQINATAVNGVDTSNLSDSVSTFAVVMARHPKLEFILQKNDETRPLWQGLLESDGKLCGPEGRIPQNATMLVDESKGTGVLATSYPSPPDEYDIGYAGGIGPGNIESVLTGILEASGGRNVWIDMESSLRSRKDGKDVFDLDKCYQCIDSVCAAKLFEHPAFLR